MCLVTIFDKETNTRKKFFVNDTRANVSSRIQQLVGSFDGIFVEDVVKKDLPSLLAMLYASRTMKYQDAPQTKEPFRRTFPAFDPRTA